MSILIKKFKIDGLIKKVGVDDYLGQNGCLQHQHDLNLKPYGISVTWEIMAAVFFTNQ